MKNLYLLIIICQFITLTTLAQKTSNKEYLDFNTARINGKVPMVSKKQALYKVLGKPDSLVKPDMQDICVSFYDKPFKFACIKGSEFEVYGNTIVATTLNFKNPHLKLVFGNLVLDGKTTLASLAKRFPNAVKLHKTMSLKGYGHVDSITLQPAKKLIDDNWILFFEDGKLVRIDYWQPC